MECIGVNYYTLLTSFFMTSSPVTGAVLGAGHILFASAAKSSHDIEHRQIHMYFDIVKSKAHVKYLFKGRENYQQLTIALLQSALQK